MLETPSAAMEETVVVIQKTGVGVAHRAKSAIEVVISTPLVSMDATLVPQGIIIRLMATEVEVVRRAPAAALERTICAIHFSLHAQRVLQDSIRHPIFTKQAALHALLVRMESTILAVQLLLHA